MAETLDVGVPPRAAPCGAPPTLFDQRSPDRIAREDRDFEELAGRGSLSGCRHAWRRNSDGTELARRLGGGRRPCVRRRRREVSGRRGRGARNARATVRCRCGHGDADRRRRATGVSCNARNPDGDNRELIDACSASSSGSRGVRRGNPYFRKRTGDVALDGRASCRSRPTTSRARRDLRLSRRGDCSDRLRWRDDDCRQRSRSEADAAPEEKEHRSAGLSLHGFLSEIHDLHEEIRRVLRVADADDALACGERGERADAARVLEVLGSPGRRA